MLILVVCTGNTCRSPMAEGILKTLIAEKLGCSAEQLAAKGVRVASAGVSASPGCAAAPEAIEVLRTRGVDLTPHASQPLTDELVKEADVVYTLTSVHREAIVGHWPDAASRTKTLRSDGGDVSDPIGASLEVYRQCADQIEAALKERVRELAFD